MIYFKRVVGDSMSPTLRNGQIIVVSNFRSYKVGDVVVAYMNGREVVKRITKKNKGRLYLVGDNKNKSTDSRKHGWVVDRHVMGKIVFPRGL